MLGGACANWESLTAQLNGLTVYPINDRIPGRLTGFLRAVWKVAWVYEDMFLGNDRVLERGGSVRKDVFWRYMFQDNRILKGMYSGAERRYRV